MFFFLVAAHPILLDEVSLNGLLLLLENLD